MSVYQKYMKLFLPHMITKYLRLVRIQKFTTKILGPLFTPDLGRIEIDITYNCNLKCCNCNRSCTQATSDEQMSLEQVKRFIEESMKQNRKWKQIRVVGGEPTLHPQIFEIIKSLLSYVKSFSPSTSIVLVTNGFGQFVNKVLHNIPSEISIDNSHKKSPIQEEFVSFNVAPIDLAIYKYADYVNGCLIPQLCGIGLTRHGYYPCAVSGGIDRIFGFDVGRKKIPAPDDEMRDLLKIFCKYCGHFKGYEKVKDQSLSPAWEKAYKDYHKNRPSLSAYGEK